MRGFAGIDLVVDAVPDETTIFKFRHPTKSPPENPGRFSFRTRSFSY
jgi:hypothetical protein